MSRQWVRTGSVATAILVLVILVLNLNILRPQTAVLAPTTAEEQQHEQSAPYRPQHEEQERPTEDASKSAEWLKPVKDWAKPPDINRLLHGAQSDAAAETAAAKVFTKSTDLRTSTIAAAPETTTASTKGLVMGRLSTEDTDWVAEYLPDWQRNIYLVDLAPNETSPTGLRTEINKSKEAMPYLTYIIDHYPDFPDVMAFIHAHRLGWPQAWHNDAKNNDAVNMLNSLRLETVMERGYVNLRCILSPGCPDEIQPWREPVDPDKLPEQIFPYIYANFFNKPISQVRKEVEIVATPCCAQFAVAKWQILQRPKEDYERYRDYIVATTLDDDTIGRVLEYMWHIIFGRDAVHCEDVARCQCEVYGRCPKGRRPW